MTDCKADVSRFGSFEFDRSSGELTMDGRTVLLTGLPLQILLELGASPGTIVSRDHLKARLWPQSERIDVERRLNTAVRALRSALDDNAVEPRHIDTVRGRGYRLLCPPDSRISRYKHRQILAVAATILLSAGAVVSGSVPVAVDGENHLFTAETPNDYLDRIVSLDGRALRRYLDDVLVASPGFIPARQLRARLLVEEWRGNGQPGVADQAGADLERVLARRADDANSLALLGELRLYADWDWEDAERLLQRSIAIDPWQVHANQVLGWLRLYTGADDQAASHLVRSLSAPNLTADQKSGFGWMYLRMDAPEPAKKLCTKVLDDEPEHFNALECAHRASADIGNIAVAKYYALLLMQSVKASDADIERVASLDPEAGYSAYLEWSRAYFWDRDGGWYYRAMRAATAGDDDAALDALVEAHQGRDPLLVRIHRTQEFAPLHSDPRYQRIAAAVTP